MLGLSYRLLKDNGLLVIKTMDIYHNGRQYWVSDYVVTKAIETGFVLIDKFILLSKISYYPLVVGFNTAPVSGIATFLF